MTVEKDNECEETVAMKENRWQGSTYCSGTAEENEQSQIVPGALFLLKHEALLFPGTEWN